jgi:hypothetical protein
MLSESERLNIYVDDAMEDNDCQEVLRTNNWVTISNVQFQYDHLHPIVLILRHSKNMSLCHHVRNRIIWARSPDFCFIWRVQ